MKKITIIGTGYVGLVTGACLADVGHQVMCLDIDHNKISILQNGAIPIYEPGLFDVVQRNVKAKRLSFTSSVYEATMFGDIQFIAVGTPPDEDGSADMKYVIAAATSIGRYMKTPKLIVNKSTVPVGTADAVEAAITGELLSRGITDLEFYTASNPEFLKEGAAIDDFMNPDRIILGTNSEYALAELRSLYAPFQRNHDVIINMDIKSAELTKYAANAMLATRISFMNELAGLAEALGADIESVRNGIGSDPRIGRQFLYAGCGYGGSCFPKDVQALQRTATANGLTLEVVSAVERANESQKQVLVNKITKRFGTDLTGLKFAMWGLAFKPNTDDMRDAPSRVILEALWELGATVFAYDPVADMETRRIYGDREDLVLVKDPMDALFDASALIIVTEWKAFHNPDFFKMYQLLRDPIIFDGRNLYDVHEMKRLNFEYYSIGRPAL